DLTVIRHKADEVQKILAGIPGVVDDHVDFQVDVPQIEVKVDLAKAARYGLKPGDVRRAAATLVAGEEVGDIFRGGRAYDVVVWSTRQSRNSVTSISALPIDTPSGRKVRLGDVARVSVQPIPNLIERQGDSRRIDVAANVVGRDLGAVVHDLKQRLASVSYPRGYHAELLGEYKERQAAQGRAVTPALIARAPIPSLLLAPLSAF